MTRTGVLTTDAVLHVRTWDQCLERMTGIPAADACGRSLASLAPEAEERGVLDLLRASLVSDTPTVLAPAIHHFLIPCPPAQPSAVFTRMQQRVVATPLRNATSVAGLAVSIEDVTARLEAERRLALALQDPDPAARRAAIEAFTDGDGETPGTITAAMTDDDWQVRRTAVGALASRAGPEMLDAIVTAVRDGHRDFSLLSSALRLLSLTGFDASAVLIDLLRSEDVDLRIQAALALGSQSGDGVVEALRAALDDADGNVCFHAVESLGRLRAAEAVGDLAHIAATAEFFLAFPAIEALVSIGDAAATPAVLSRLGDSSLQEAAAQALGTLGDEDVVRPLLQRLERIGAPIGAIVTALAALHGRYEEVAGGGGRIEDLTRRALTGSGARAILDFVVIATGAELRYALLVLSWTRTESVASELARLLSAATVPHDVIETLVRFGSPIVDVLIRQVLEGETDVRRAAAVALGRLGDRRAVPALITVLREGGATLSSVAGALARLGDQRAFEPLLDWLGHPDPAVRHAIIGAINSIGHPETAVRMATLLKDADPNVRQSAAKIAGYFGYAECAEALIYSGIDPDERVRAAALEHVAYLEHSGVLPLLTHALRADTPRCRAAAAAALGYLAEPEAADALLGALADDDAWVRYFAALSLGRLREPRGIGALSSHAVDDPAGQVRIAAIDALGAIGGPSAMSALEPLTASIDSHVSAAALRAVGEVRLPASSDVLKGALRSVDPARRVAAAQGLVARGDTDAVDALRWAASADDDQGVASAALQGLGQLAAGRSDVNRPAVHALAAVAADPSRRAGALRVLSKIPAHAVPALESVLQHADPVYRTIAVEALGRIARPPASSLLALALDDPEPDVRARAIDVLSRLGARGIGGRLAHLAQADASLVVRRAAEAALSRAGGADAQGLS